jgi:hypothetical protein
MSDAWIELRSQIGYFSQPFPEAAIAFADARCEEVTPFLVEAITRRKWSNNSSVTRCPNRMDAVWHRCAMAIRACCRDSSKTTPQRTGRATRRSTP